MGYLISETTKEEREAIVAEEFNARYVHGEDMPGRSGCGYK